MSRSVYKGDGTSFLSTKSFQYGRVFFSILSLFSYFALAGFLLIHRTALLRFIPVNQLVACSMGMIESRICAACVGVEYVHMAD